MKSFSPIAVLSSVVSLAVAQATFNITTDVFDCASPNGNYCGGDSLKSNIIIRCAGSVGLPGNCDDNLAGIPPLGVKIFAPCYQSSEKAGDAACSFNGIVYPDVGASFPIPSNNTSTSTSSAFATISAHNVSSSIKTSLATSHSINDAVNSKTVHASGSMKGIDSVGNHVAATKTSLEPNTKVSSVTAELIISSGTGTYPSPVPYYSFKNGPPVPFPIKAGANRVADSERTTLTADLNIPFPSPLAESLPSVPGIGPSYRFSVNGGNSSHYATVPSGMTIGTGRPSMTTVPFINSADVTTTSAWTCAVGMIGLVVALL